jgi:hypothetical protein
MTTPQELLNANGITLDNYKPGQHYAICPQCSAKRQPKNRNVKCLGVRIESGERVCWHCCHCEWSGPEKGNGAHRELPSYVYRDAAGTPRFRKVRNIPGREPRFWLERADGKGGWTKGTTGVDTKILYRRDEVTKAIAGGRVVAGVEGEKDTDNLWALGIPATCNAQGASEPGKKPKWTKAHSEQLAGADLVVFNDNDAPGYEHANATCRLSLGIAKRVRRLDLAKHWPDIPKGGDVSDWLAAGHSHDELVALMEGAPDYAPQESTQEPSPKPEPTGEDAEIERLARLKPRDYERERKAAAKKLSVRASILDRLVNDERIRLGLDSGDDWDPKQADTLVTLAARAEELFHAPDGTAFARIPVDDHLETWPVRSKGFRRWLSREFFNETKSAANSDANYPRSR